MSHIFISYSRANQDYARRLTDDLRQHGFDVWIDNRIDYGDRWWRTIVQAVQDCSAFIVIMSPESEKSEWVEREILLAQRSKKPIFPLLLEGQEFALLITTQFVRVEGEKLPGDDFYHRLSQVITPLSHKGGIVTPQTTSGLPKPQQASDNNNLTWFVTVALLGLIVIFLIAAWVIFSGDENKDQNNERNSVPSATSDETATPTLTPTPDPGNVAPVVVSYQDLPRGFVFSDADQLISSMAVGIAYYPIYSIPAYSFNSIDQLEGLMVRSDIPRGSIILQHQVYNGADTSNTGITLPFPVNLEISTSQIIPSGMMELVVERNDRLTFPPDMAVGDYGYLFTTENPDDAAIAMTESGGRGLVDSTFWVGAITDTTISLFVKISSLSLFNEIFLSDNPVTLIILHPSYIPISEFPLGLQYIIETFRIYLPENANRSQVGK